MIRYAVVLAVFYLPMNAAELKARIKQYDRWIADWEYAVAEELDCAAELLLDIADLTAQRNQLEWNYQSLRRKNWKFRRVA